MVVNKIRPTAEVRLDFGMDGRDQHYYIHYSCPVCGQNIWGYRSKTACDRCGTFYDWGNREPRIVVSRSVEW